MLTMGILGAAVMRLSQRLAPGEDADLIAADILDVTLAGLQSGVRLRSKGIPSCVNQEVAVKPAGLKLHHEERE
jgi:hypothetical protein